MLITPFPTMFSALSEREIIISATFILSSANAFKLDQPKNLSFGKELIVVEMVRFVFYRIENIWERKKY